ncbi:MAG TPA: BTAD domain-containing putative transcriptional regulator [Streptosporangiaceae bacterium]|nr:BTAD domain-containing putative transcriptional regulator [Streptosporangiaceae bacterium]
MTAGIRVLGPLEAEVEGARADLGGPLQRAVLALLLMERGRVVSVDRMIDQLWRGEPPPRAIASLQAYVSNLRRILEPGRARRAQARILVSAPPGYAVRLPDEAVDAWRFESLLTAARKDAPGQPERARQELEQALALWRGPAYAEFADEEWATAEVLRLTEQHLAAQEAWAEVALRTGAAAEAVPAAEALIRQQPLREGSWRLLALSLWACDRQADALAALRRARRMLRDELGLEPGPALAEVEEAILGQRQELLHRVQPLPAAPASQAYAAPASQADGQTPDELFVGRGDELRAIAAAAARHAGGVVLITGEGGAGKTRLLDQAVAYLMEAGWTVVTGSCPDAGGAPSAWAWTEALRALATHVPPAEPAGVLGVLLDPDARPAGPSTSTSPSPWPDAAADTAAARFRLHQAVVAWLRQAAATRPVAVLLDDLHQADAETLALLETVAAGLAGSPLLLMTAYRPAEAGGELEQALGVLARRSPARLPLAGLPAPDAAALISSVYGGPVEEHIVQALADRTGGNPFYLRESAKLLASEGALVAVSEVPEGVRDVLRRRLARLPPPAVAVLRLAATVGQEAEVEVLVDAADTDEDGVITGLEAGVIAGLLTEPGPGRVRFVHALVRDTMYADLTQLRLTRMHARVGAAIRRLRPGDVAALAHHYLRAASADSAEAAVGYAIKAAERADRRYSYDAAVSLLEQALEAFARIPGSESDRAEQQADLLGRLLRAQIRAGRIAAARATRQRAADAAASAGRDDLVTAAFAAWTEPTPWQTRPYGMVDDHAVAILERQLERNDQDQATRCRLLAALVAELAGEDDPRPARAAAEAEAIARRLGHPDLLALALTAGTMVVDYEREPDRRAFLAAELASIGHEHGLPEYEWYAEYIAGTAAAVLGQPGELRRRLDAGQRLADEYRMAEPQAVQLCSEAMLAHVEGRFDNARRHYAEATGQMRRNGSLHADGFHRLAQLTIELSEGRAAQAEPLARTLYEMTGPLPTDAWVVTLAAAGRAGEARRRYAEAAAMPLRTDFFHSIFATFRAMAVIAVGDRTAAEALVTDLTPVAGLLAGAASAALAMQPVAQTLGELSAFLGRPQEAARHFAAAQQVARRWNSPHWAARARAAASRCPPNG